MSEAERIDRRSSQPPAAPGTTALEAVKRSAIVDVFPEIDLANDKMGIFSNILNGKDWPLPEEYELQENDRVEIYRPLQVSPKEARRLRAEKKRAAR